MEELSNSEKRAYGIEPVIAYKYSFWQKLLGGLISISLLAGLIMGVAYLILSIGDKIVSNV